MRRLTAFEPLVVAAAVAVLGAAGVQPAAALPPVVTAVGGTTCQQLDIRTGFCLVRASSPGQASPGGTSGGTKSISGLASCYGDWSHKVVPCSGSMGSWSNSRDCYVQPSRDNPLPGSLLFEGHTDGAVYSCTPDIGDQFQLAYSFWSAAPPTGPDPAQLAQQAISTLGLTAVTIGIVPEATAGSIGLVGMPVWMWVANPTAATWGPATSSAAAGGITVTATAHVDNVVWNLGDGTSVTCGAGTPYSDAAGSGSSPDCGHTYARTSVGQPGDAYGVTATSHWVITWAGGGQAGQEDMALTAEAAVQIGEAQAIVTG